MRCAVGVGVVRLLLAAGPVFSQGTRDSDHPSVREQTARVQRRQSRPVPIASYSRGILSAPRTTIRSPSRNPLVISTASPIVRRVLTSLNSNRSGVR